MALPVEVIVALGTPASVAAKRATEAIPIVVQTGDPVAAGIVSNLAHPGGNVTGFSGQAADAEGNDWSSSRNCSRPCRAWPS
ncbi:MAG: ABC transporter substrate binding protein [Hyphomicrobiaceae bacterium]